MNRRTSHWQRLADRSRRTRKEANRKKKIYEKNTNQQTKQNTNNNNNNNNNKEEKRRKKTSSSKNRILGKFFATRLREKIYAVFFKKVFLLMPFSWNFCLQALFEAGRAVLNTNSKMYFRKITGLLTVKKRT